MPDTANDPLAERCRVVLVRPAVAANIGAVARVMRNFGLIDLRLVAPHADHLSEESRKLSTHGERILHAARTASDLGDAVGDCVFVVGASARTGGRFREQSVGTAAQIIPKLLEAVTDGPVSLVFGPEQTGLENAEVTRCHYLLAIPTDASYPALNLAQAVAITLYELRRSDPVATIRQPADVAPFELQERMYQALERSLRDIHFLWGGNADALMHAMRHLIGRARPTRMEVDLLLGLARQLQYKPEAPSVGESP